MSHRTLSITVFILLLPHVGRAAEVVLREQAAPRGPIVRLGDLAEVRVDADSSADVLANAPLMTTPAAGERRFVRAAQLRDLLYASGVNVRELRFSGAEAVLIAGPAEDVKPANDAVPPAPTDRAAAVDELTAAVVAYLREQTGHDLWEVEIVPDRDLSAIPAQEGAATVSGGKAPWTGRQRFTLGKPSNARGAAFTADVQRIEMAAVALRTIERGDLVRTTDVELRPHTGSLPGRAIALTKEAVGKEAVQTVRAGAIMLSSQLRAPVLVRRGERVSVRARSGGVTVRTYAVAQQDGSLNDLVMVTPTDSKDRYVARVSGVRELEVFAAGATADDVATHLR
jgi:flagella basal body P-ring formation protein FlgA